MEPGLDAAGALASLVGRSVAFFWYKSPFRQGNPFSDAGTAPGMVMGLSGKSLRPAGTGIMSRLKRWVAKKIVHLHNRIVTIRRPERILVIHIAKTAGTSLRRMLQDEYGPLLVYPGDWYLQQLPDGWYPLGSEMLRDYAKLPPHNVLIGHFTAAMADMLPRRYRTAVFLREPIQRSLSMLGHFSRTMTVPVPTLVEDAGFMAAHIADYQTRILGAEGVCDPHQVETIDDAVLTRAVARLETIDFVGLTERFPESCVVFDELFRTGVSKHIRREGMHRPEGNELAEYVPQIEPIVRRDRVLYETALARFNAAGQPAA